MAIGQGLPSVPPVVGELYEPTFFPGARIGYGGMTAIDGVWIEIRASSRPLLLEAARALRRAG